MNIGGKRVQWWWLAVAVVFVGVLAAVAVGRMPQSGETSLTDLGSTPAIDGGETATAPMPDGTTPKSTTPTATASSSGQNSGDEAPDAAGEDPADVPTDGTVIVKFWDKTQSNRADEVDIRLAGEVWSPLTGGGTDTKEFGPIPLDKKIELKVYPDGPSGTVLIVPLIVKPEMSGSTSAIVHIEMRDGRVRSLGNPVVNFEVAAPRG